MIYDTDAEDSIKSHKCADVEGRSSITHQLGASPKFDAPKSVVQERKDIVPYQALLAL